MIYRLHVGRTPLAIFPGEYLPEVNPSRSAGWATGWKGQRPFAGVQHDTRLSRGAGQADEGRGHAAAQTSAHSIGATIGAAGETCRRLGETNPPRGRTMLSIRQAGAEDGPRSGCAQRHPSRVGGRSVGGVGGGGIVKNGIWEDVTSGGRRLNEKIVEPPSPTTTVAAGWMASVDDDAARHLLQSGPDKSAVMNPALANFMLARTPDHIAHPETQLAHYRHNMASPDQTYFTLNTGAKIPAVGLGTWQSSPGEVKAAVAHALKQGYRHIDAALVYQNETEVGQGLQEAFASGISREEVFVTTKLWNTYHRKVEACIDESLKRLGLDYVDLYLVHWPVPINGNGNDPLFPKREDGSRDLDTEWSHVQTWKAMEKLLKTGKAKAIGVSNYSIPFLEELLKEAEIVPAANQIENHPYLPQQETVDFCREKGILVEAYSPLGSTGSPLFSEDGVQEVAKKHNVGPGTVLISYQVSRGIVVLPKSVTPTRIEENIKTIKFDDDDLKALESIHKKKGVTRFINPAFGVNLGWPDKQ
nr:d-galacturonate reductase [Quercus suber]